MKRTIPVFIAIICAILLGCKNELEDLKLGVNPADPESGLALLEIDSVPFVNNHHRFYYHVLWENIPDSNKVFFLSIYKNGKFVRTQTMNFLYFIDLTDPKGVTNYYEIAIRLKGHVGETKKTEPYFFTFPN